MALTPWVTLWIALWMFATARFPIQKRFRLDPDWSEKLEAMQYEYDEEGKTLGVEEEWSATRFYSEDRQGWILAGHLEFPYNALLYKKITPSHPSEWVGVACGGILIKPDQVLSTCGCLYGWEALFRWRELTRDEQAIATEKDVLPYMIYDPDFVNPMNVYLTHAEVFFERDFSHKLINELAEQHSLYVNCTVFYHVGLTGKQMIYGPVLANFDPPIIDFDMSNFIPWPPVPITGGEHSRTKMKKRIPLYPVAGMKCRVVGFGFELRKITLNPLKSVHDDLGNEIIVPKAMVDVEFETVAEKLCFEHFPVIEDLPKKLRDSIFCLQMLGYNSAVENGNGETRAQLENGLPGTPVITAYGNIAGMIMDISNSTRKEAHKRYYVALNFVGAFRESLELETDSYLLKRAAVVRAPLYREKNWEQFFLQYSVPDEDPTETIYVEPKARSSTPKLIPPMFVPIFISVAVPL